MNLSERIAAARGQTPADLLLTNLQLVNVFSGEIYPSEIAIKDELIIGVGAGYTAAETIDLGGRYVAPGLIDAHVHIESSMCIPPIFSEAALTHGVTTVVTDPHEIANVHGLDGIRFMLELGPWRLSEHVCHGVKLRPGHAHGNEWRAPGSERSPIAAGASVGAGAGRDDELSRRATWAIRACWRRSKRSPGACWTVTAPA